jgi:hypothetical protein
MFLSIFECNIWKSPGEGQFDWQVFYYALSLNQSEPVYKEI